MSCADGDRNHEINGEEQQVGDEELLSNSPLLAAVKRDDIFNVENLLENCSIDDDLCLLHISVERNSKEMTRLLLKHGANVNHISESGITPISLAIMFGDEEMLQLLLENGADVNVSNADGWTPLHLSVRNGDLEATMSLVKSGVDLTKTTEEGWGVLHFAAQHDKRKTAEYLINSGADVNAKGFEGATALHLATLEASTEMLELLISRNAEVDQLDNNCYSALMHATYQRDLDKTRILLQAKPKMDQFNNQGLNILHIAAIYGDAELLQLLLDHGATNLCQVTDENGFTALTHAIISGLSESVVLLLGHEEDFERRDMNGWTSFHHAVASGSCDKLELLLQKGYKDTPFPDKLSPSSLHVAAINGFTELVPVLIKNGADVNARDGRGFTPLHTAVHIGQEEAAYQLLQLGADTSLLTNTKLSPLHIAVSNGNLEMTQLLACSGENINSTNEDGETVLHIALRECTGVMVHLLCSLGADPSISNNDGNSATHLSILYSTNELLELMIEQSSSSICEPNIEGFTPLQLAVKMDCPRKLETILRHVTDKHLIKNSLEYAMKQNSSTQILNMLDEAYTDKKIWNLGELLALYSSVTSISREGNPLDNTDDFDQTFLHYASLMGIRSHIHLFIENGASLFTKNSAGTTPLQILAQFPSILCSLGEHIQEIVANHDDIYEYQKWFKLTPSSEQPVELHLSLEDIQDWTSPTTSAPEKVSEWLTMNEVSSEEMLQEFGEIRYGVDSIMQEVSKQFSFLDPDFKVVPILVGSIQEGTKCGYPDQFDYLLHLVELSGRCEITVEEPGLALKDGTDSKFGCLADGHKINVTKLIKEFDAILYKVLQDSFWKKSSIPMEFTFTQHNQNRSVLPQISLTWCGKILKHLNINLSMKPAVEVALFSNFIRPFPIEIENTTPFVVPASSDGLKPDYFQVAMVTVESSVMDQIQLDIRLGYILAKKLSHPSICPCLEIAGFDKTTEARQFIAPHLLKTCLLFELDEALYEGEPVEKLIDDGGQSIPERILFWADRIYARLQFFLDEGHMPSYHIPQYDLLSGFHIANSPESISKSVASKKTQMRHIMLAYCDIIRNKLISGQQLQ